MKCIMITGLPGAGKTHISKIFEDKGILYLSFHEVIEELMNVKLTRTLETWEKIKNYTKVHPHAFEKRVLELAKDKDIFVFEGARHWQTYEYLSKYAELSIVYVDASFAERLEGIKKRDDLTYTKEKLKERDNHEWNQGTEKFSKKADYVIKSRSSKEKLSKEIDKIIAEVKYPNI